jgi:hypothetical protein
MKSREMIDRMLGGHFYDGECNVVCPVCGNDYAYVVEVLRREPVSETVFYPNAGQRPIVPTNRPKGLAIIFECEGDQHRFEIVFDHHKGVTTIQTASTSPVPPNAPP